MNLIILNVGDDLLRKIKLCTRSMDENINDFLKIVSYLSSVNGTVSEEIQAILLLNSIPSRFNSFK